MLLAGGEARRLPGKLERTIDGVPLTVRAFRAFRNDFDVVVSVAKPPPPEILAELDCRLILDTYARRGPLGGMLSACGALERETVFFVPADAPFVDVSTLAALREARRQDDEVVVPTHEGQIEPLVGLYVRRALLREGLPMLERGDVAVHRVIQRLRARRVPLPAELFRNLNTLEDWKAAFDG